MANKKLVVYAGQAHVRKLTAGDIARMGLEQKNDFEFRRGEPQEVSPKLADLLVRSGEFDAAVEQPPPEVEDEDSSLDDNASGDQGSGAETPTEDTDA